MNKLLVLLLSLTTIILGAQNRESDSLALIEIYQTLDGENWNNNNNWLTNAPINEWTEVTVNNDRVVKLRVLNINASGAFPLQVYNLTELTQLVMSNVAINGPLPAGISALTKLNSFTMINCGVTGNLPSDISQLQVLESFSMNQNQLTGPLPDLGPNVNRISLNSNQFTGVIPLSWATDVMRQVNVNNNQLTGSLDIFGSMLGLDILSLFHNNWDSQVMPDWLDDLPVLRSLQCGGCNFVGDVPEYDFSNSPELYQIIVNDNSLTGDISNLIPSPVDDNIWLDAGNNLFEGELPAHLLSSVGVFAVDNNNFTSISPMNLDHVGRMDIVGNRLTISDLAVPLLPLLMDSVNIYYGNQQAAGDADTVIVYETTSITLDARDNYPDIQYQWYKNNQAVDGAMQSTYIVDVAENGTEDSYDCKMTYPLFVEDDGYMIEFHRGETTILSDFPSGVNDLRTKYNVLTSPNPAMNYFYMQSDLDLINVPYKLWTMTGKEIKSGMIGIDSRIEISDVDATMMILSIKTTEGLISIRIIKD